MGKLNLNKCIKLCADYMSTGVWAYDHTMMDTSRIPISDDLFNELLKWTDHYDNYSNEYDIGEKTIYNAFNVEHFSHWGRKISQRLQAELPDWSVTYFDEMSLVVEYVIDPIVNYSAWQYKVSVNESGGLHQMMLDWLDESGLEHHCRWPDGQIWFKRQEDAAYFTLRWL